mgnify:CR=1 FL=1
MWPRTIAIDFVDDNDGVNLAFNYVKKLNTNCKFLWMKNPKCFEKNNNGDEILKNREAALKKNRVTSDIYKWVPAQLINKDNSLDISKA